MSALSWKLLSMTATFLIALAGCSSADDDKQAPAEGDASGTVGTAPFGCRTSDGNETTVTCEVAVSDVWVSQNTLALTINAYTVGRVLPTVCEGYGTNPLEEDPQGFNNAVRAGLRAMIEEGAIGWSVDTVSCAAP